MVKKSAEIEIPVTINPEGMIVFLEGLKKFHSEQLKQIEQAISNFSGEKIKAEDPEIRIIEMGALPAAYFMRDSVIAAIHAEIVQDIKNNQPVPNGVEVINGETNQISDSEDDQSQRGDGSESPKDGSNNGSAAGSSGEDHNRQSDQEHSDSGSEKSKKSSGQK